MANLTAHGGRVKLTRSDAESAAQYLDTAPIDTITRDEVMVSYRRALRAVHPDVTKEPSADEADSIADAIATLKAAKDMLLEWVRWRPDPNCRICNGTGFRRTIAFGSQPCPMCTPR